MAKVNKQEAERNEELAAKVSSSEKFYNEHKGLIWGVLGGIVVIGLAILVELLHLRTGDKVGEEYIRHQGEEHADTAHWIFCPSSR